MFTTQNILGTVSFQYFYKRNFQVNYVYFKQPFIALKGCALGDNLKKI